MSRIHGAFAAAQSIRNHTAGQEMALSVELFVGEGFNEHETACITKTLSVANALLQREAFVWRYVSDTPGLVSAEGGLLVRAHPAIDNHAFSDIMIVVGGRSGTEANWLGRVRQMKREARTVVLLSDAATAYIRAAKQPAGKVTTHWQDITLLQETGYYPGLTDHLAELSAGIITAAGSGATQELMIGLISPALSSEQIVELGNRLLLPAIRKNDAEQPSDLSGNASAFGKRVTDVITLMEENISDPLDMSSLMRSVGLSTRQGERIFREVFDKSPAKFYKHMRTRKAWALVQETLLPLSDIAVATGFGTVNTLSNAIRKQYGVTATQARARKEISLMKFK